MGQIYRTLDAGRGYITIPDAVLIARTNRNFLRRVYIDTPALGRLQVNALSVARELETPELAEALDRLAVSVGGGQPVASVTITPWPEGVAEPLGWAFTLHWVGVRHDGADHPLV